MYEEDCTNENKGNVGLDSIDSNMIHPKETRELPMSKSPARCSNAVFSLSASFILYAVSILYTPKRDRPSSGLKSRKLRGHSGVVFGITSSSSSQFPVFRRSRARRGVLQLSQDLLTLGPGGGEVTNHVEGSCQTLALIQMLFISVANLPSGRSSPSPLMMALKEAMVSFRSTSLPSIPVKTSATANG